MTKKEQVNPGPSGGVSQREKTMNMLQEATDSLLEV